MTHKMTQHKAMHQMKKNKIIMKKEIITLMMRKMMKKKNKMMTTMTTKQEDLRHPSTLEVSLCHQKITYML